MKGLSDTILGKDFYVACPEIKDFTRVNKCKNDVSEEIIDEITEDGPSNGKAVISVFSMAKHWLSVQNIVELREKRND